MAQAVWTGSIAFGLVNVPVKLYTAVTPKDVRFHQFQRGTNRRIRYARVADEGPAWEPPGELRPPRERDSEAVDDGSGPPVARPTEPMSADRAPVDRGPTDREEPPHPGPVPYEEIVKGYEIEPGRFVTVTRDELEALTPRRTGAIDIEEFVDLADIDPIYFEKTYYLAPAKPDAVKPYSLLRRAMAESGKVAIGRFVMRTKEYLAAIRPMDRTLALQTLFYEDEIRPAEELPFAGMEASVSDRELQVATQLISVLAAKWEPQRYRDTYREQVLELLESKTGDAIVAPEPEEREPPRVADLMEALKRSVAEAKKLKETRASGQ